MENSTSDYCHPTHNQGQEEDSNKDQHLDLISQTISHDQDQDQERSKCCFKEWMTLQELDLDELLLSLSLTPSTSSTTQTLTHPDLYSHVVDKNLKHFEEYAVRRAQLAQQDVSGFFAPTWCTSLENSLLWIAGCRPSLFVRLVYDLCGVEFNTHLDDILHGNMEHTGNLGDLSTSQLRMINTLQRKTIKKEEKLTSRLASLQEDIADRPIAVIARRKPSFEPEEVVERAIDEHEKGMVCILERADKLRLKTLRELMGILNPVQQVELLAAGKKLHLCLHAWGKRRDQTHGRGS